MIRLLDVTSEAESKLAMCNEEMIEKQKVISEALSHIDQNTQMGLYQSLRNVLVELNRAQVTLTSVQSKLDTINKMPDAKSVIWGN